MKRRSKIERLRLARHRNANLKFSTTDEDDDSDENPLSKSILRKFMNVSESWRNCRRRTCKRGRGCRGREVQCASERPVREPPRNPDKAARDQARKMAIFQRMVRERLDAVTRSQEQAAAPQAASPRRRRRAD